MDALMLDGNAIAGLLQNVFGVEMTTAVGVCAGCGAREPFGAMHLFRGAGFVLRCPHCGALLATIVTGGPQLQISLAGIRTLTVPRETRE